MRADGFCLVLEFNVDAEKNEQLLENNGLNVVYSVRDAVQTLYLCKAKSTSEGSLSRRKIDYCELHVDIFYW